MTPVEGVTPIVCVSRTSTNEVKAVLTDGLLGCIMTGRSEPIILYSSSLIGAIEPLNESLYSPYAYSNDPGGFVCIT